MTSLLALLTALSLAQQPPTEAERLRELERQIEEQERSAAEIRSRTQELEGVLETLQDQLVSTASALQAAEARATELEQDLQDIEAREAVALEDLDKKALELSSVLAALQNLERSRPPALVVSPGDAQSAALAAISLSSLTPRLADIVEARKAEIEELARLRERKRGARAQLEETNEALGERRRLLEDLMKQRRDAFEEDQAALRRAERETRRLAAEASSLRELLNRLAELPSTEEIIERYRQSRRDRDLPARFADAKGRLDPPVAGTPARTFARDGERDAVELVTRPGAVVTAPFGGVVQWASQFGSLGNVLIVDVGGGFTHIYVGLDQFIVSKGQRVGAGEPVGVMSPQAQNPRLRFQVRDQGRPVDPTPWFSEG
ncbi:murein hydrolase activator EnvC family protein [Parvularcula maris]|uniref:Peptidoglycan DD-metalloendopeptidase family protein n=1 Tax=Parvularcula maris TaxID=2965077 RepID=A0A9X2L943_9PROT|nr:peptidoglycan DD-metalloendopeptidase family protein [Parvularcula maris]MCQ8185184.1 peptidoglycan DD-metalloendopeptidase family protein [Parvularcula maris]